MRLYNAPMIPFEEIDSRLETLGKNRAWLAHESGRKPDSIRVALAPNATKKNRSPLLQKVLSGAIEREEARQAALASHPPFERQQLVLRPTDREYAAWCREAGGEPLQDWALKALNEAARRYLAGPVPVPAPEAEQQA